MASYFNSAGSKVTIVEMLDHIGGDIDLEIAGILQAEYEAKGIEFKLKAKVVEVTADSVICEEDGQRVEIKADKVLLSVGRRPVVQGFGLETIGVEVINGRINTDEQGRTNIPGVYAAGDVNGRSMLAHTAYREAEVCVNNMVGRRDRMTYDAIPWSYTPTLNRFCRQTESQQSKG